MFNLLKKTIIGNSLEIIIVPLLFFISFFFFSSWGERSINELKLNAKNEIVVYSIENISSGNFRIFDKNIVAKNYISKDRADVPFPEDRNYLFDYNDIVYKMNSSLVEQFGVIDSVEELYEKLKYVLSFLVVLIFLLFLELKTLIIKNNLVTYFKNTFAKEDYSLKTVPESSDIMSIYNIIKEMNTKIFDEFKEIENYIYSISKLNFKKSNKKDIIEPYRMAKEGMDTLISNYEIIITEMELANETIAEKSKNMEESFVYISSKLNEKNESVSSVKENMDSTIEIVEQGAEKLKTIKGKINEMQSNSMDSMEDVKSLEQKIKDIEKSSEKVGGFLYKLDEISEKTNLLALNAAIEASRAGEAGRGFGVVAEEIRILSNDSVKASKEIKEIMKNMIDTTGKGKDSFYKTVKGISYVVEEIEGLRILINEMIKSSISQSKALDKISNEVGAIQENTDSNYSFVNGSIDSLKNISSKLDSIMRLFNKITIDKSRFINRGLEKTYNEQKIAHIIWKLEIIKALEKGAANVQEASDYKGCSVGKWLESEIPEKYKNLVEYKNLVLSHKEAHILVKKISKNDIGSVKPMIDDFNAITERVLHDISKLENKINELEFKEDLF